ncbi:MAG: tetratricopeptide repeat protein [Acidobacteria bacterium]|nr:tetratricopeptide repeat protein [Acidobacteriota bacterium]
MSLFFSFNKEKSLKAAEKYTQQGKIEAAIKEYERILEADPADLSVCVTLAGLYAQVKRNKDAAAKYLKVADYYRKKGNLPQSTALYRKANRLDPTDYSVALVLADLLNKQGLTSDALQIYVNASHACKHGGHYVNAVKVLREAVKLNPDNPYLKMELAEALFGIDSIDEAHDIYVTVGREFYHKAQLAEGLQAFQKALVVKPGSKPALRALTDFSLQHGDRQGAVAMLQELLENTPNDVDLIVLLGRTCLQARMYPEAEEAFLRLLDLDPQRYEYLLEVARGYVNSGEYNRAVVLIGKCLDLIVARRHKKRATAILKNIVSQDPRNLMALTTLADIYERVGEKRNLTTTLNTVVEVALEHGLNKQARMALERLIGLTPGKKTYRIQLAQIGPVTGELSSDTLQTVELDDDVDLTEKVESSADYSTELLEEMLAKNPELAQARIKLIEDLVAQQPDFIEARQQLKQRYVESGLAEKAALECLEIARLYETRENYAAAEEIRQEAYFLNPYLNPVVQTKLLTGRFDVSFLRSLESGEMLSTDSAMEETVEMVSPPADDDVIELNVTDFLQSPVEFSQGGAKIVDSTTTTFFEVPGTMEPVSAKPSSQTAKIQPEPSSNAMVFEIPRTPEPQLTSSTPEVAELPESPAVIPEPAFESWDSLEAQRYAQDFLAQAYQMYQQAESPAIPEMSEIPAISEAAVTEPPPWETNQGSGFESQGSGFESQGSGFRVQGSGVAEPVVEDTLPEPETPLDEEPVRKFSTARLFAISASGGELFTGPLVNPGLGFETPVSGFESPGSGFRVPGSGFVEAEVEPEPPGPTGEIVSAQFEEVPETEAPALEDAGFAVVGEVTTFESQGSGFRVPGLESVEVEIEPEPPTLGEATVESAIAEAIEVSESVSDDGYDFAVVGEVTTFEIQGSGIAELTDELEIPTLVEEDAEPVTADVIEPVSEDVESQALQYELMHQEDSGQLNEDLISREFEASSLIENQFGEVLDTEIEPVHEADDLAAPSLEPLVADLIDEDLLQEPETDYSLELKDVESQALQYELIQEEASEPDDNLISREIELAAVLENQFGEVLDTEIELAVEPDDLSVSSLEPLIDELVAETKLSQEETQFESEPEEPEVENSKPRQSKSLNQNGWNLILIQCQSWK